MQKVLISVNCHPFPLYILRYLGSFSGYAIHTEYKTPRIFSETIVKNGKSLKFKRLLNFYHNPNLLTIFIYISPDLMGKSVKLFLFTGGSTIVYHFPSSHWIHTSLYEQKQCKNIHLPSILQLLKIFNSNLKFLKFQLYYYIGFLTLYMYCGTELDILSQVTWKVFLSCLSLVRRGKLCSSDGWEPPHWLMWGSAPKAGGEVTPC